MPEAAQPHWQAVYRTRAASEVSWFEDSPACSLAMIEATGLDLDAPIIDVGAGASNLVDHLLERGFRRISVLDVSAAGLEISRRRLGARADEVTWLIEDVNRWSPPRHAYALWHDRAVFHFLTRKKDREAYVRALRRALRPGGFAVMATFAPTGPQRCSGLPVNRYSPDSLGLALGPHFELLQTRAITHVTPGGVRQDFNWCLFRKAGS